MKLVTPLDPRLGMKYGAGGRAMRALIRSVFVDGFGDEPATPGAVGLAAMDDGAALPLGDEYLVVTTDSHVVKPIFFPGGDIGRLAISGTVNDLAMMGATEVDALTLAVVLEEGFPLEDLRTIQRSMRVACEEAGARVVTGDTKLMGRGELDGIIINTSGVARARSIIRDAGLRPGDKVLISGTIADHGLTVLSRRQNLELQGELRSDVAPLNGLVRAALSAAGEGGISAMKDPTRGGLAGALQEMAEKAGVGVLLEASNLPIADAVRGASELLGIDPLHVANEGKVVLGVRPDRARAVLAAMREHPFGRRAAVIGEVIEGHRGSLILETGFGRRIVPELEGEPLPRIC